MEGRRGTPSLPLPGPWRCPDLRGASRGGALSLGVGETQRVGREKTPQHFEMHLGKGEM